MDQLVMVMSEVLSSVSWQTDLLQVYSGVPFSVSLPSKTLVMDSYPLGWGAYLDHLKMQRLWFPRDV